LLNKRLACGFTIFDVAYEIVVLLKSLMLTTTTTGQPHEDTATVRKTSAKQTKTKTSCEATVHSATSSERILMYFIYFKI
jgi:hypothetical protein